jgi:hypothetical protein
LPVIRPLSRLFLPESAKRLDGMAWRSPCSLSVDGDAFEAYCMRNLNLSPINQVC